MRGKAVGMQFRAIEFHIRRGFLKVGWTDAKASRKRFHRVFRAFGGGLPDEKYYFDELAKRLSLERVTVGLSAMKKIHTVIFEERRRMVTFLTRFIMNQKAISELVSNVEMANLSTLSIYLLRGAPEAVVFEVGEGRLVTLCQNDGSSDKLVKQIFKELKTISKTTQFSGYALDKLLTGKEIVESYLANRTEIITATSGKPKSSLEKWMQAEVKLVTDSYFSNLIIQFKGSADTEEYDCVVALSREIVCDIEATDYSLVTAEIEQHNESMPFMKQTLKSTLLTRCQQKAARIGAMALIVAKGFPSPAFNDLSRIGRDMGVILVDENSFRSTLEDMLTMATITHTPPRSPTRTPEEFARAVREGLFQM